MSDFWIGFIIGGFICGIIGFLIAAILAASGRASRMEERDVFRDDVPPYETPKEIAEREKRKIAYLKMRGIIITQNNPRTD